MCLADLLTNEKWGQKKQVWIPTGLGWRDTLRLEWGLW